MWQPILWAVVLGILFRPLLKRIALRVPGQPSLAAGLTVLAILVFVMIPALVLVSMIVGEGVSFYTQIKDGAVNPGSVLAWMENLFQPWLGQWATRLGIDLPAISDRLQDVALRGSEFVLAMLVSVGQNAAAFFVNFFLMLYLLFFILRDGPEIYGYIFKSVPLPVEKKKRFFNKFAEVSIATVKGTVVVGLVQGALGGAMFAILGINGALFWGATMAVASVLPIIGAALIWAPAAFIFVLTGAWIKGLVLLAYGIFVIGLSDNLLRPIVVGRETRMPDFLILFSTIGGRSWVRAASCSDPSSPRCSW